MKTQDSDLLGGFGSELCALCICLFLVKKLDDLSGPDTTYISGLERAKCDPTLKIVTSGARCLVEPASQLLEELENSRGKNNQTRKTQSFESL